MAYYKLRLDRLNTVPKRFMNIVRSVGWRFTWGAHAEIRCSRTAGCASAGRLPLTLELKSLTCFCVLSCGFRILPDLSRAGSTMRTAGSKARLTL